MTTATYTRGKSVSILFQGEIRRGYIDEISSYNGTTSYWVQFTDLHLQKLSPYAVAWGYVQPRGAWAKAEDMAITESVE